MGRRGWRGTKSSWHSCKEREGGGRGESECESASVRVCVHVCVLTGQLGVHACKPWVVLLQPIAAEKPKEVLRGHGRIASAVKSREDLPSGH